MNLAIKSALSASLMTVLLAGCASTEDVAWEIEGECSTSSGCSARGKISGTFKRMGTVGEFISTSETLTNLIYKSGAAPDAALFSIQVSGTMNHPTNGQAVIKLVDSNTNSIQAINVFDWVRTGSTIHLAHPDIVNSWALANGGSADSLDYELVPWTPSGAPGPATMIVESTYGGITTASDSASACFDPRGEMQDIPELFC